MKKLLITTALLFSLGACVSNTATNGMTEYKDKFTGTTSQVTDEKCLDNDIGDEFCLYAIFNKELDTVTLTFSYTGDDWMFMEKAEARIMNTGQTFTLFDEDYFDISRDVWCCGLVRETWTKSFKMSTIETNPHPIAQMIRAEYATENPKVVVRLTGAHVYSDFD